MDKTCHGVIKSHADKTKDMPTEGVMAFCTFYNEKELKERLQEFGCPTIKEKSSGPDHESSQTLGTFDCETFDWGIWSTGRSGKKTFRSGMTKLRFELKAPVAERQREEGFGGAKLPENFDVVLFPNSVFMMPLHTNRLYTHATVPGVLDVCQLPTRLGYVARCSKTEAVHKEGGTYLRSP